jgi:hypothetical protein
LKKAITSVGDRGSQEEDETRKEFKKSSIQEFGSYTSKEPMRKIAAEFFTGHFERLLNSIIGFIAAPTIPALAPGRYAAFS